MIAPIVLVVDDDDDLRELLAVGLEEAGYRTLQAGDGAAAADLVQSHAPDLVLLDVGLQPGSIDGFEVCRRIRQHSDVPIVFLTGRADDIDQLMGLTVGGDDYLMKPVSPRLLVAHVAAVLRRSAGPRAVTAAHVLETPGLRIDLDARTVTVNGDEVDLTKIQFELLAALAEHPSRVLSRNQLVERVWGEWYGADHHLDVHMSRLRAKVLEAGGPRVVHAVRGVGFRLRAS